MSTMQDAQIGDVIAYRLAMIDMPVNPNKLWHGRVRQINKNQVNRVISYDVDSIEYPDTAGELVYVFQVVSIEPAIVES